MKQGSTDDPFAEGPESEENSSDEVIPDSLANHEQTDSGVETETSEGHTGGPRDIPYIFTRDAVKQGRRQRPVYLREYNESRISNLVAAVEADLGEEVPKTDVLEAAMETAIENPDIVAETLRSERYGYDWE